MTADGRLPDAGQLDALAELVNIGVGRAAGMLHQMIGAPIELAVPEVKVLRSPELDAELGPGTAGNYSFVRMLFGGRIQGAAALVFPPESAANLVAILTGEEEPDAPDLDAVRSGTLSEVGNIVINGVMGSIANLLQFPLRYELPTYFEGPATLLADGRNVDPEPMMMIARTRFAVADLEIEGMVLVVLELASLDVLLRAIEEFSA